MMKVARDWGRSDLSLGWLGVLGEEKRLKIWAIVPLLYPVDELNRA
jgi:hypothetical protein